MSEVFGFMIPNTRSYTRFVNDARSNIEGNRRMAEDIFDFLITNEETSRVLRKAHGFQNLLSHK
jgi:hypothetical protein